MREDEGVLDDERENYNKDRTMSGTRRKEGEDNCKTRYLEKVEENMIGNLGKQSRQDLEESEKNRNATSVFLTES